jgi:hypothetical protein
MYCQCLDEERAKPLDLHVVEASVLGVVRV